MLSNEFMRYLIGYQPDGYEYDEKSFSTTKEIEFKDKGRGTPVKVWLALGIKDK